jgi:hypothetical protein
MTNKTSFIHNGRELRPDEHAMVDRQIKEVLDEFAKAQFNPTDNGIESWEDLKEVYTKYSEAKEGWKVYIDDIEKAVALAVFRTYEDCTL